MNGLRKRIACVTLALFVAVFSLLSHPIKAHANAFSAVTAVESAESFMILLDMLYNAMLIGGAAESVSDYNSDMSLLDAFMNFARKALGMPEPPEAKFYRLDGSCITLEEFVSTYTDGTGALQLPDEDTWANYRVIEGGGSGDSSGEEPEEPEEPNKPTFTKIETFTMNSGFLAMLGDFVLELWNGDIEGISFGTYANFDDVYYNGIIPQDASGNYLYYGECGPFNINDGSGFYTLSRSSTYPMCGYINEYSNLNFYQIYPNGNISYPGNILYTTYGYNSPYSGMSYKEGVSWYHFNFPVFPDSESAKAYLQTGKDTGCLNGLCYDYPALVESIPNALAPLAGLALAPDSLQALNTVLATAVEVYPLPDIEPAENTAKYKEAVTVAVDDYISSLPEPEPDPSPEPEPTPEPEPEPGTDRDTEIDTYKRNLSGLFPFCLPFDLIALLDALDAEPVAPCFEIPFVVDALNISMSVELDLSFLDEVAELIRLFETIGFIITLIMVTHKLIKW